MYSFSKCSNIQIQVCQWKLRMLTAQFVCSSDFKTGLEIRQGASQEAIVVKNLPDNAGDIKDAGSVPGLGRSPGGGNDNPLQYSCLENPMDRGAWRATVYGVTKSWIWLSHLEV